MYSIAMNGRPTRKAFTLIELLIAMTILTIIMVMMLRVFISIQNVWKLQVSIAKVQDNSRALLELLERDFNGLVVSDADSELIPIYINTSHDPNSAANSHMLTFVSNSESQDGATSRMNEIAYRFHKEAGQDGRYTIQRQLTSNLDGTNWDFFNMPSNWYINDGSDPNLASWENVIVSSVDTAIAGNSVEQPYRALITMTVFDDAYLDDLQQEDRDRSKRFYQKTFYLKYILR